MTKSVSNKKITESKLQYDIVQWAQREGYICFHCPNGEKRDKITANKLMAMGVKAGIPDLIFILPNGITAWVELKLAKGKLSKPQEYFKKVFHRLDHHYILVQFDDSDQAIDYLDRELSNICRPQ